MNGNIAPYRVWVNELLRALPSGSVATIASKASQVMEMLIMAKSTMW